MGFTDTFKYRDTRGGSSTLKGVRLSITQDNKNKTANVGVNLGGDVLEALNWAHNMRLKSMIGTGEDHGKVMIVPDENGNILRRSGRSSRSGTFSGNTIFELPPNGSYVVDHVIVQGALIINLPPELRNYVRDPSRRADVAKRLRRAQHLAGDPTVSVSR